MEDIKTIKIDENKDILSIALNDLLKGKDGESHMTYIDLSTDMNNPTEITNFTKSGIYVAKNKGMLGFHGEALTILPEGMFFRVYNLKDLYEILEVEVPDEQNAILIQVMAIEGYYDHLLAKEGIGDWQMLGVTLNSINVNDYVHVDIDTSMFLNKYDNVSYVYGIHLSDDDALQIVSAKQHEIDTGEDAYKPITCNNIEYAVKTKGEKHFATKDYVDSQIGIALNNSY